MGQDALRKGLESLVAEGLRRHVLEAVLARPEVVANLSPEALQRLRASLLDRLLRSEEDGRPYRESALAALRGLQSAAGPLGALLGGIWKAAGIDEETGAFRPAGNADDPPPAATSGEGEAPSPDTPEGP